jgi:hypothetical protein
MHAGTKSVAAVLAVLAVVASVGPVGAAPATAGQTAPGATAPPGLGQIDFEPSETVIRVHLREDGGANWTVSYELELATANDTAAFRDIQDDVAANESAYVADFAAGIRATVADAERATGREMSASAFAVRTRHDRIQDVGYVVYEFEWSAFAAEGGDRIVAGDALAGFYLERDTTLRVSWPDAYALSSVEPAGAESENAVTWTGQASQGFDASGPRIVVSRGGGGPPLALVAGALALAALAAGGLLLYRRRDGAETVAPDAATETAPDPEADEAAGESPPAGDSASPQDEPPAELLSNEEQVLRFLEERGGRAKQQEVVETLDWTAAKTSQVVSDMHDEGAIEKFRLGRENVLKLPDEDDEGGEDQ